MDITTALTRLLGFEGGYTDNPDDPGGKTIFGITENLARKYGYAGDMKDMRLDVATRIYHDEFWYPLHCDELPDAIRYDLFDAAVNSGRSTAVKWLQNAVGVKADGVIGPATIAAANAADPAITRAKINGARLAFMTRLPGWAAFSKGWAMRIAVILTA